LIDTTDPGGEAMIICDGSDYISIVSYKMHKYNQGSQMTVHTQYGI